MRLMTIATATASLFAISAEGSAAQTAFERYGPATNGEAARVCQHLNDLEAVLRGAPMPEGRCMIVEPGFEVTIIRDIGQRSLVRHVLADGRDIDMWTSKHVFTTPMERGECDAPNAHEEIRGCL